MKWAELGMGDQKGAAVVVRPWGTRCSLGIESYVDEASHIFDCSKLPQDQLMQVLEPHASSSMMRVLVKNFGEISVSEQCKVAHQCRSFRESRSNGMPTQFVFDAGRWNWVAFTETWQRERAGSPFLQHAHIRSLEPLSREGVWAELAAANCVSLRHNSTDELCCNLVAEFTGGRAPLVEAVISQLGVQLKGDIEKCLHSVLWGIVSLHEVIDAVRNEWSLLCDTGRRVVANTLCCHFNRVRLRDVGTVDALLSGLVVQEPQMSGPNYVVLTPSCKCVEQVMFREVLRPLAVCDNLADVGDSCVTVMAHAYRKTLEIECLLRQLLVSYWTVRRIGVRDALRRVKVSNREQAVPVSQLFQAGQRPSIDVAREFERKQRESSEGEKSLLDSAVKWQDRQFEKLDQADVSLMAYVTSRELEMAIENDHVGIVSRNNANPDKPFQQEAVKSIIERFRPIRDAVAHCQPICYSAITTLEGIREELVKMVTAKSDSFVTSYVDPR